MKKVLPVFLMLVIVFPVLAEAIVLTAIEEQSPRVWGINGAGEAYVPKRGGIKVCKAEGKIIVGFYLSDGNIEFYKQTFPDGKRKPIGFEIDINDRSKVFNRDNLTSITTNFPSNLRYDENYMGDGKNYYTVGINDPTKLKPKTWYTTTFKFSRYVNVARATFEVNVQLVGDIRTLRNDYHDIYNGYGVDVETQFFTWFNVGGGKVDADGNNFFGIWPSYSAFYADHFFDWPEGTKSGYDRFLWNMAGEPKGDYQPYSCSFGGDPWSSGNDGGNNENESENGDYVDPAPPLISDPGDTGTTKGSPDANVKRVEIDDKGNNWHHSYIATPGQKLEVKVRVTNKGDKTIDYFEVKIYRSNSLSFNKDKDHCYGREEEKDDLKPGKGDDKHRTITAPSEPGTYYIYAYINRVDGKKKTKDKKWDNNISRNDDPEEYAVLVVKAPEPPPPPPQAEKPRRKLSPELLMLILED